MAEKDTIETPKKSPLPSTRQSVKSKGNRNAVYVIDLETTGLFEHKGKNSEIIEYSLMKLVGDEEYHVKT